MLYSRAIKSALRRLTPSLLGGVLFFSAAAQAAQPGAGAPAPDFTAPALQGPPIALAALRGKPVLLAYWASWCAPCRRELDTLQKLHTAGNLKFAIVALNLAETRETARDYAARRGLSLPIALDLEGDIAADYQVLALPASFLIDGEGRIVKRFLGELSAEDINAAVAAALKNTAQ